MHGKKCCGYTACYLCILVVAGFMVLTLWLTSKVGSEPPKCSIESLYLPSLNKTFHNHNNNNNSIFFTLKLVNPNDEMSVQYDVVHVSFDAFVTDNTTVHVDNATLEEFYQGYGKKAVKSGSTEGHGGGVGGGEGGGGGGVLEGGGGDGGEVQDGGVVLERAPFVGRGERGGECQLRGEGEPEGIRLGNVPAMIGSRVATGARGAGILVSMLLTLCVYLS